MIGDIPIDQAVVLVGFLLALPIFAFINLGLRKGQEISLRKIPGMENLSHAIARALEEGQKVHVSVGTGKLGENTTVETMAGLTSLDIVSAISSESGVETMVTVSDPTLLPLAQDIIRKPRTTPGRANPNWPTMRNARFMGPDAITYAAGTMDVLEHEPLTGNIMIGAFGPEFLLMGESSAKEDLIQVVGTTNPQGLPYMQLASEHTLVGEEIFATGAYISRWSTHLASLVLQDTGRLVIVGIIFVGVVLRTILG